MTSDDPHDPNDDPIVIYRTIAILMAALAVALLFIPFDWLASGGRTREIVGQLVGTLGDLGTRLLFAVPSALVAYFAARQGWGSHGE